MCGIFGIFSPNQTASRQKAKRAALAMVHRGPDDEGIWNCERQLACLAHRRLSLVAIENGHQPIFNEDRTVVAVVNGEFYGYREIRKQLENLGHRFKLDSDSEIVVHLYEHYGLDFVDHLRGEFALLIWDADAQRMIAARDRFGIKPLVYSDSLKEFTFASEAKVLLRTREQIDWDMDSLFWAASLQYTAPDRTLFAGIKLLAPGQMAIVDQNGLKLRKYWDLDYPAGEPQVVKNKYSFETSVLQTRDLLRTAIKQRLDADAKICFHLSGGLDSSTALGIAARETGNKQTAFTIGFEVAGYDESNIASETAKYCDAEHHILRLSEQQLYENILPAAKASEGLAINGHLPAKYLLNQTIRSYGFSAVITGEGADETFLGYAHLKNDWWASQSWDPQQLNLTDTNRSSVGMMLPFGEALPTDAVLHHLDFVPSFLLAKATLGFRIWSLLNDDLAETWRKQNRDAFQELMTQTVDAQQVRGRSRIHQSAWLWTKICLAGYILKTLGDGTEMATSIEGRLPFLDHHLFQFVREQPLDYFFNGKMEKHLLREAAKPYLPNRIYRREKHPFDAPPLLLNTENSIEFFRDQINSESFRQQPVFDRTKVLSILDQVDQMNRTERQVWDPAMMMVLSSLGIQQLISENTNRKVSI